jgi:hypothetical protein
MRDGILEKIRARGSIRVHTLKPGLLLSVPIPNLGWWGSKNPSFFQKCSRNEELRPSFKAKRRHQLTKRRALRPNLPTQKVDSTYARW